MNALLVLQVLVLMAPGPRRLKVAVPDLRVAAGVSADHGSLLADVVAKNLADVKPDRLQVITSGVMQSILGLEHQKRMLGCQDDSACLVEMGNALGADTLISGSIGKIGNTFLLSVTVIDPVKNTSEKAFQRTVSGAEDGLLAEARDMGTEIGRYLVETHVRALDERAKASAAAMAALQAPAPQPVAPAPPSQPAWPVATPPATGRAPTPPAKPTSNGLFPGAIPGFPYAMYPAPPLDPAAAARVLKP